MLSEATTKGINSILNYLRGAMRHLKKINAAIVIALLMAVMSSCGYHMTSIGGVVPQSAKTIAIPVFINDTYEPYIDVDVTKALVEEFLTDGRLKVVDTDAADIVVQGKVTKFDIIPQTYSTDPYVLSYNVFISVDITVIESKTEKVLLQSKGISTIFNSTYAVTLGNISQTKISKEAAVQNACTDLASTLRSRVLEGF